ncbi:hypothetical protein [Streptomyces sp. NPDC059378]|uniref:hypothetical protein n=1 Tax=Streptomyces sp. NPDC059378 TaxID=3346815 RepID=UPI003684FDFF
MHGNTSGRRGVRRIAAITAGLALGLGLGAAAQASAAGSQTVSGRPAQSVSSTTLSGAGETLPAHRMARVLKSLLPKGGKISDEFSQDGYAQLVWNDGHGKSMIGVNAQPDMGDVLGGHMGCEREYIECQALVLADGTLLKRVKRASEKGGSAVVWVVDTLHPDGRRVVIQEVNAATEGGAVTRPEPPLTLDQLQTIALNPRWAG